MFDTHAHLTANAFAADIDAVLERAVTAGVEGIVVVSESAIDCRAVLELASQFPHIVRPALGFHPEQVAQLSDEDAERELDVVKSLLHANRANVVAIGEIGLDFTPRVLASGPGDVRKRQTSIFSHLLNLASCLHLPVSVHSRGAGRYALDMLMEYQEVTASMHAFDGRAVHAERALVQKENGLYFSIPPSVIRSSQLQKLTSRVPLNRLLLETDSPVLGPVAKERNEPANITCAVNMMASVRGVDVQVVRDAVRENSISAFPRLARENG